MDINIRKATTEDFPQIILLIRELAAYEKAAEKVTNTVELMNQEQEFFHCYVAETETKEIAGMVIYFFAYYTWVGKSLYLEDIYVKESFRRQKTGTALLRKIFEIARNENCKRVRWQVLNWNTTAIQMYSKNGAEIDDEWLNCNFDSEAIRKFPSGS
jgi:ribosomal protein S18 acetylase RimI-like enzyme